ncbi:MAG: DsrE family protein [Nannocystaceae bacterium]
MNYRLAGLVGAGLLLIGARAASLRGKRRRQRVVYHVNDDDPRRQAAALRNIQNHVAAVGADRLDLKVVLHGAGLSLVLYPEAQARTKLARGNADANVRASVRELRRRGVQFKVCANTVRGAGVTVADDLFDVAAADVVPSGVVELAALQSAGYAYIKP